MSSLTRFLVVLALAAALSPASPALAASQGPYSLDVLVDGRPMREYPARGTTYVEARRGREYALRIRNHTGERIAVALTVDGLNSIDARHSSASDARKWIVEPYGTVTISGWQTGSDTARRFFFTSEEDSYGEWLGDTRNLGTIAAAFFRERRPVYAWTDSDRYERRESRKQARQRGESAPSAAPQAESGGADARAAEPSEDLAATGIGREVDHRVRRVRFEAEAAPAAVVEVRYEYRDALVRLGVIPRWDRHDDDLARRERARGFEDDYAPDPYRGR